MALLDAVILVLSVAKGLSLVSALALIGAGVLIAWFLVLLLVMTPARLWEADQKRLTPKLDIILGDSGSFTYTWQRNANQYKVFRICVVNLSETDTIEDVRVSLEKIEPHRPGIVPVYLHLMHDNVLPYREQFDLHAGGQQYIDVVYKQENPGPGGDDIVIYCAPSGIRNCIPKARYTLTIKAEGRNVPPCTRQFIVDVSEDGRLLFEPETGSRT